MSGELRKQGRRVKLQDQPFQILLVLLERPGEVVTREELRLRLWPGDTFVDFDHGLNNGINRLREALSDSADAPRFIETLPRRGYRFIADVNAGATERPQAPSDPAKVADAPAGSERASAGWRHPGRTGWLAAAVLGVILALMFSWPYLDQWRRRNNLGGASIRIRSIAVLPLENLSGDPSQDYFAAAMTDGLTTDLGQMPGIRVISRTSAMRYRGVNRALPDIAKELDVDAVVEGSASRSPTGVHVNAQLIYAPTDQHLWAHAYDVTADNVPKLQSEIAGAVAKAIGTTAGSQPSTHVVKPEAYDLYLRAALYYGVATREANDRAVRLLEGAVAIDPGFAAAYAALTSAYRDRGFTVEPDHAEEWVGKAMVTLQKSLSLDPNLAEAYVSRGIMLWSRQNGWAHERAVEDFRHALSLDSNLAEAHHQLANVYNHVGLLDKAELESHKALELDPLNVGARFRAGINLLYRGKYEDSLAVIRDSENFDPILWVFQTSFALQHLRRIDEAQKSIAAMHAEKPDDRGLLTAMQALLAADAGDSRQAEDKIGEALERGKAFQHFHHVTYAVASAYALLHNQEPALRYLQLTADDGFPCYPLFEHDSNLDSLRNNPQFQAFMARQKTQWNYFQAHL